MMLVAVAFAGDTWTSIRTGVDHLHRTTSEPQDIHAVRIDLTVPNVGLHASADSGGERGVTTPTFAASADVLVAINADWSDGYTPVGLAIADGSMWHSHIADDSVGGQWGYFACTATKSCTIGWEEPLDVAWWFASPTIYPYRYYQAVGANGQPLIVDGVSQSGCYDSSDNPRSAVCLDATGTQLWLVVVDGRTSSAAGMTCDETRSLLQEFGCHQAAMLDGGGSSTLVIDGDVVNNPSDGSPRTVSNHFGIVYSDSLDPSCQVSSGGWCEGTVISVCQGGRLIGSGDCAYYGASCAEEGDYAFCVDYRCPDGDPQGRACLDGSNIAACTDGQYGEGDCGVFGLACGTDAGGAACMDSRCEAGPHSAFCTDAGLYAACTDGVYAEGDCAAYGLVCWEDAVTASCVDARCPAGPDGQACAGEVLTACAGGVYAETDCAASGLSCDDSLGCVDPGSVVDSGEDPAEDPTKTGLGPGEQTGLGEVGCGCASGPPVLGALSLAVAAIATGRARRGSRGRG